MTEWRCDIGRGPQTAMRGAECHCDQESLLSSVNQHPGYPAGEAIATEWTRHCEEPLLPALDI